MNKKRLTLGITFTVLMAAALSVTLLNNTTFKVLAQNGQPQNYVASIDKDNRLKPGTSDGWFGFKLHGSEEYGCFYASHAEWININPTGEYSDYAFSWTNTDGSDYYFEIDLSELPETSYYKETIDGKSRYLRGFPGANKITTVFYNPNKLSFDKSKPSSGWNCERTNDDDTQLTTDVATLTASEQPSNNSLTWCLREQGSIYIKSITIEYTC